MIDTSMKNKLYELQNLLNNIAPYGNIQSKKVLNISKELDILIIDSYLGSMKSQKENKI